MTGEFWHVKDQAFESLKEAKSYAKTCSMMFGLDRWIVVNPGGAPCGEYYQGKFRR